MSGLLIHINHLLSGTGISFVFIISFVVIIIGYCLVKIQTFFNLPKKIGIIIAVVLLGLFVGYFGVLFSILLALLFIGSLSIGGKVLRFSGDPLLGMIAAFFVLVEIYTVVGVTFNPTIACITVFVMSSLSVGYRWSDNRAILLSVRNECKHLQKTILIIDYWLVAFCFLVGSLPQSIWDAVQANLYNAKWYVLTNSFSPLHESISSLFPQNAITYYSLFYKIGLFKGIEFAMLLPLLFFLYLIKKFLLSLNAPTVFGWLVACLVVTPMVVFQATNGYYDLLVTTVIFLALYLITFTPHPKRNVNLLLSAFFIGFAVAMKYFPLVFIFLPISFIVKEKIPVIRKLALICTSLILSLFPVGIWTARAYQLTHSPVFPFFQKYFPTPQFWPVTYILDRSIEATSMIQTTAMTTKQWITGGFLTYPVATYFHTEFYLESVHGFSGTAFILFILYTILLFILFIRKVLTRSLTKFDYLYSYLFVAYIVVGLVTRYYRYVWPYQLIFAIYALIPLLKYLKITWVKTGLVIVIFIVMAFNFYNIKASFTFIPIFRERLLHPDYYSTTTMKNDPISFLNHLTNNSNKITIADIGTSNPGRFNFSGRVYQCSWYWIGFVGVINKANNDSAFATNTLQRFDYIVADTPVTSEQSLCRNILVNNFDKTQVVYQDQTNTILKVLK